jgi:hypothetical protein
MSLILILTLYESHPHSTRVSSLFSPYVRVIHTLHGSHPYPTWVSSVQSYAYKVPSLANHGHKGTFNYVPRYIPPGQCTQGYTSMHSTMHPFLTTFTRVHSNAFIDASTSYHVLKGTILCIPGCIPSQPCTYGYIPMHSKVHLFPTMYSRVHLYASKGILSLSCIQG